MEEKPGSPFSESGLSGKLEKDKRTDKKKKDASLPTINLKTLSQNLDEIFGRKKSEPESKPDSEADGKLTEFNDGKSKPERIEASQDSDTSKEQQTKTIGQDEFVDLRLHEPMTEKLELPLNRSASTIHERVQPAQTFTPEDGQTKPVDSEIFQSSKPTGNGSNSKISAPGFLKEQLPLSEASSAVLRSPSAEFGGSNLPPRPPDGSEFMFAPEPEPLPELSSPHLTVPAPVRMEQIQNTRAAFPLAEKSMPTAETPPEYKPHSHPEQSGAIVGLALWESWRHHRMNKRTRKIEAKQNKHLQQIEKAQAEIREQQTKASAEQALKERQVQRERAMRPTAAELTAEQRSLAERLRKAEVLPKPNPEKLIVPPEQTEEQQVLLPTDHRLVRSEWHSIEIDKSGHAVASPVFEYGQEFKREQRQETHHQAETAPAEFAGYSATNAALSPSQQSVAPKNNLAKTLSQAQLSGSYKARQSLAYDKTNLWLWIILTVIILAIFATLIFR